MSEPGPEGDREELRREIQALERRIASLEKRLELRAPPEFVPGIPAAPDPAHLVVVEGAGAVPVLGRALLGLAGAYLFRALTESHTLPLPAGVLAGIVYALGWLVWAARTPAARRVEAVFYSLTSALVLGPLLWEATIRFHAISTAAAAAVLLLFTVIGLTISWRKNLLIVATIATLTGVLSAAALLIGSHDIIPFTYVMLAIAAAVEASACLDHWLSERWLTATAADLAVLLATYLVTNARGLPEVYVAVGHPALLAAQMALPAIYLSSTLIRTEWRGLRFIPFEGAQMAVALALGIGGGLRLMGRGSPVMALVCLGYAAVCYPLSFALLRREGPHSRNGHTYAIFGLLLVIGGSRILLPGTVTPVIWGVLAVGVMALGSKAHGWHGSLYLVAALLASGALPNAHGLLLGIAATPTNIATALWGVPATLLCYGMAVGHRQPRLERALLGGAAFWLLGSLAAAGLIAIYHGVFGAQAPPAYCASLRTMVLALGALLLGWLGAHWNWTELKPVAYAVMGLGAYRLLFVDLRQDQHAALVLSLLFYGGALVILPRWIEPPRTASG